MRIRGFRHSKATKKLLQSLLGVLNGISGLQNTHITPNRRLTHDQNATIRPPGHNMVGETVAKVSWVIRIKDLKVVL